MVVMIRKRRKSRRRQCRHGAGVMLAPYLTAFVAAVSYCHAHSGGATGTSVTSFNAAPPRSPSDIKAMDGKDSPEADGRGVLTIKVGDGNVDFSYRNLGPYGVPELLDYLSRRIQTTESTCRASSASLTTTSATTTTITRAVAKGVSRADAIETTVIREDAAEVRVGVPSELAALSLRECALGDTGVAAVARSPLICGPNGPKALSLRQNQVTAAGIRSLLASLRASSEDRLSYLELDFNPLSDGGVQPLVAYLQQRASRGFGGLEELSLRFCDIGPAGCRYLSSALLKSATAATSAHAAPSAGGSTKRAYLAGGEGTEDLKPHATGIRKLLLTGNRVGDAGARALASALRKDRTLEVLDLSRCQIGDDGARCLADALRTNTCLRELRLGYNDISADGASALASLLHAGPGTLETLELGGNRVGDGGAVALAQSLVKSNDAGRRKRGRSSRDEQDARAMKEGPGLLRLDLSGNGIGCVGACALAKALKGSGVTLEELELAGNTLTLSTVQAAQAKKNSSLYKSAGGALSSLLNQFVDDSYYRTDASLSSKTTAGGGTAKDGVPLRCGVLALGSALARGDEDGLPSIRVLGLAKTGITERDAAKLASMLGRRRLGGPLEQVEVSMNGLSSKAVQAITAAVDSPQGLSNDDNKTSKMDKGTRTQRKQTNTRREQSALNGDGMGLGPRNSRAAIDVDLADGNGRRPPLRRSFAKRNIFAENEGPERGGTGKVGGGGGGTGRQVGAYTPTAGKVELEMFGRKVASFCQTNGRGRPGGGGLDVQVFGKRVRLDASRKESQKSSKIDVRSDDDWEDDEEEWSVDDDQEVTGDRSMDDEQEVKVEWSLDDDQDAEENDDDVSVSNSEYDDSEDGDGSNSDNEELDETEDRDLDLDEHGSDGEDGEYATSESDGHDPDDEEEGLVVEHEQEAFGLREGGRDAGDNAENEDESCDSRADSAVTERSATQSVDGEEEGDGDISQNSPVESSGRAAATTARVATVTASVKDSRLSNSTEDNSASNDDSADDGEWSDGFIRSEDGHFNTSLHQAVLGLPGDHSYNREWDAGFERRTKGVTSTEESSLEDDASGYYEDSERGTFSDNDDSWGGRWSDGGGGAEDV